MANKILINGENLLFHKKLSLPEKIEDPESDKKALRMLQLVFQTNLHKFIRKNKEAFGGALDLPLNRSVLTKQDYQANKRFLESLDQNMDRLMKGMVARNSYLEKQLKSFQQGYRESSATPAYQNPQKIMKNESQYHSTVLISCQNTEEESVSKSYLLKYQTTPTRPFTAFTQTRQSSVKRSPFKLSLRPQSSQLTRQTPQRNTIPIKNIEIHKNKIDIRESRKVPLFRQSLGEIKDYEKYVQQEVYIRKKIVQEPLVSGQNRVMRTGSAFYSRKDPKPSIIQRFKNVTTKEFFNEVEKERLHNKIMMVNTVLAFNLNQTQGYKAKSKCLSNKFI